MSDILYRPMYHASHAVLIGIDRYQVFPPLYTAIKGVQELTQLLQAELGFLPEHIITLENEQATQRNIRRYLTDPLSRADKVSRDDRVLIYFAGHGVTVDSAVGEVGYIVPIDGEPGYEDTLISMDELTRTASERIHAKHVLFLLDACFSGFATTRLAEGAQRQLNDYLTLPCREVITAGTRDQTVSDSWGPGGHSLFTGFLLEGLRGNAPMPGGILRGFHLAGYLQDQVAQHSQSLQTPQFGALIGSQGGDFIFSVSDIIALPAWLTAVMNSSDPTQRMVAVRELMTLARGDDERLADTALHCLERLAEDEDVVVQSSAAAALRQVSPAAVSPAVAVQSAPVPVSDPTPHPALEPARPPMAAAASSHEAKRKPRLVPVALIGIGGLAALLCVIGIIWAASQLGRGATATEVPTELANLSGATVTSLPATTPAEGAVATQAPTETATAPLQATNTPNYAVIGATYNAAFWPDSSEGMTQVAATLDWAFFNVSHPEGWSLVTLDYFDVPYTLFESGHSEISQGTVDMLVQDGVFRWESRNTTGGIWWSVLRTEATLSDFSYYLEGRQVSGTNTNSWGVVLGFNGDQAAFNYYSIRIDPHKGYYKLEYWDSAAGMTNLQDWTYSVAIAKDAENSMTVVKDGDVVGFYMNSNYVDEFPVLTPFTGRVGIAVGQNEGTDGVFEFDNVFLFAP